MSRMRRRTFALSTTAPLLTVLLIAGCSSNATTGSTTTDASHQAGGSHSLPAPPAPPNASAISQYLEAPDNAVLAFERATTPLVADVAPSKATCEGVARGLAANSVTKPDSVTSAVKGIASTAIQVTVNQDVQAKLILLSACARGADASHLASAARATSQTVRQTFSQLGVSI